MSGNDRNLHLTPDTLPPGMNSTSDDSILDTTFEERGHTHLSHLPRQTRPPQYNHVTHGNAQAIFPDPPHARRRLPQLSPEGVYLGGGPRHPRQDDSLLPSERTAPRRLWTRQSPHMPSAIEQATRTPEHGMNPGPATATPIGMGPITPPVRYNNATGDDSWLPTGRETFTRPTIHTSFDLGANFSLYQASSTIRPHFAPAGFRPFPLPPPPRQDIASGPLAPSDGMGRRSITSQAGLRDTDTSNMDFSMASFTSPTQLSYPHQPVQTSRLPGPATNNRNQGPQAPPTIESIQREIAYWQRNQAPLSTSHDMPPPPNPGLHAPYMTPEARAARQSREEPSNVSSMEGGNMDISANSINGSAEEPVVFTSVARAHIIQQTRNIQRARRNSHSSRTDEADASLPVQHQAQDISDSSMSSRNGSDRPPLPDGSDRPPYRVDNRIDEQPELDLEQYGERNSGYDRSIIDTTSEAQADEEEEDDEEGEESNASSTRHLREDELEILILENLGFHGDLTRPGQTVPLEETSYSDIGSNNSEDDARIDWDQTGLESDTDELAIRSAEKPSHTDASKAKDRRIGDKKRKRIQRMADKLQSRKRISEFDVEKRRKQWLSEKEDRALRRGPVMGMSQQEFKEDMLDSTEWKQLIHHELSATAWKYIPVIGPGFLPSVHLAELGHSSAHSRPMPRTGMPSGPLHSTHHRTRNVNMATIAAAHEAIAYGQAGEEYGIRVLPLAAKFQELQREEILDYPGGVGERGEHGSGATDSESDTEMAEDSLDKAEREDSERKHPKTHLEGSFGRLAVDDPQRAMVMQDSRHL